MTYLKRNMSGVIEELLGFFPVVIILGVRQCGKTTIAKQLRPEWRYFDLERHRDFEFVTHDFEFFFKEHPHSIIIDEAQRSPELFQELRSVIDRDRSRKNRFLLTGSSSLELIKSVSESLAGRVGIIELGTLKMNEIASLELPEFYSIFKGQITPETIDDLKSLKTENTYDVMIEAFLKGGFPEPVLMKAPAFHSTWMEQYFQTYIQRDIRSLFPRLAHIKYQRFVSMLSSLSGTIINRSQVGRSLDFSEKSVRDYLDIVQGSYIWRQIPSYEGQVAQSIVKMPKGNFRDSGLGHFIQGIDTRTKLLNYPNVGASFEAFVFEEIIKGVQASQVVNWKFYYYRTRNGAEIDMILKGPFGVIPIEIKFGVQIKQRQIQALKSFVYDHDLPLGIVVNNSDEVQVIADRIVQIPSMFL